MANDDHGHGHGGAHAHSARMYYVTYLVLAACTLLTFTAAQHDFGRLSFAIAMFIALVKAIVRRARSSCTCGISRGPTA